MKKEEGKKKGHKTIDAKKDDAYYINLTFVLSTYKIHIQIRQQLPTGS